MCLSAAHAKPPSTPAATASAAASSTRQTDEEAQHSDGLTSLSSAIGALVQDNVAASRLLLHLCTQVS